MLLLSSKLRLLVVQCFKQYSLAVIVICMLQILFLTQVQSASSIVGVIYPDIREPYNKIFTDIADGVEEQTNGHTKRYALKKDYSQKELEEWLTKNNIEVCVGLGRRGENALTEINNELPIVLSGILSSKDTEQAVSVISMAPSPDKLFAKALELKKDIKEIIVVYNPKKTQWLINKARDAATKHGITLTTLETKSLSESAKIYRKVFQRSGIKNAAIWLPPDSSSVDNKAILSYILEKSWSHNIVVFSSGPAHVNKGALFALYPDNFKLGQRLAELALGELGGNKDYQQITPAEDLHAAINKRTAEHLGINVTSAELRLYEAVFPSE